MRQNISSRFFNGILFFFFIKQDNKNMVVIRSRRRLINNLFFKRSVIKYLSELFTMYIYIVRWSVFPEKINAVVLKKASVQ